METVKVLLELGFQDMLMEAYPQTQSGTELLKTYKSYLLNNPVSCGLVNSFVKESSSMRYDKGVNELFNQVTDYIGMNKVSWQIATVCEQINNTSDSRNYLNRNAAKQAVKLLEMDEEDVVKYIKSGALKNIMFCEAFRTIANNVFHDTTPLVSETKEYTRFTPISMVENLGDCVAFVVAGRLFTQDELGRVSESYEWDVVSDTFKTVESLLESKLVEINEDDIKVNYNNQVYTISEDKIMKNNKEMSISELREDNDLYIRIANPLRRKEFGQVLESIALLAENFDKIASLDNVQVYATPNDRFMVIENGTNLLATSISSNHQMAWSINEDAIKVLDFIKSRTNIVLSENYEEVVKKSIEKADEEEGANIKESLRSQSILSTKERIALLTEKFKNDPAKLAVLSKCAEEVGNL